MFEKVWKPYFDTWSQSMNDLLEKYFRSPSTLQGITGTLNTTFKGKKLKDKAMHLVVTSAGLPSYRDQKRLLHLMTKFGAQLEDLEEKVERFAQPKAPENASADQMAQLFARLDSLTEAQEANATRAIKAQKAASKADAPSDFTAQFAALNARLDALAAQALPMEPTAVTAPVAVVVEELEAPVAAKKSASKKASAPKATKSTTKKKTPKKKSK